MGEFLAPQLSEPTNRKWPVRLAFLAVCKTRLKEDRFYISLHAFYYTPLLVRECVSYRRLETKTLFPCTTYHLADFPFFFYDVQPSFTYLMSSSLAKMMTPRALEVSISLLMIFSNSPGLGSLGIFIDCAIHSPPVSATEIFWNCCASMFFPHCTVK